MLKNWPDNQTAIDYKAPPALPADAAFFLDVDGTLLEIAEHPDAVSVRPELVETLSALHQSIGAVALVSGRSLAGLDRIFSPHVFPAAGLHGVERRDGVGRVIALDTDRERLAAVREKLLHYVAGQPGTLLEDKGSALAIHYREAPAAAAATTALAAQLVAELDTGFMLQHGKMVVEIKPSGANKGTAISAFMNEPPFAGLTPVFAGDDTTDEDGFRSVNDMGGISVKVGSGPSLARWRLQDTRTVLDWLKGYLRERGRRKTRP